VSESAPVVTLVSTDTHLVSGEVLGLPAQSMPDGKTWQPSQITLSWLDGRLHSAILSGQVHKRNGERYANGREYSVNFMTWNPVLDGFTLSPTAPQWVVDLINAHAPRP
jgi:hypothetical protein